MDNKRKDKEEYDHPLCPSVRDCRYEERPCSTWLSRLADQVFGGEHGREIDHNGTAVGSAPVPVSQ